MSQWSEILTAEQLDQRYAATAKLDPGFARNSRAYWEIQSVNSLRGLMTGAWTANDPECYQMARSYLALQGA